MHSHGGFELVHFLENCNLLWGTRHERARPSLDKISKLLNKGQALSFEASRRRWTNYCSECEYLSICVFFFKVIMCCYPKRDQFLFSLRVGGTFWAGFSAILKFGWKIPPKIPKCLAQIWNFLFGCLFFIAIIFLCKIWIWFLKTLLMSKTYFRFSFFFFLTFTLICVTNFRHTFFRYTRRRWQLTFPYILILHFY